MPEAGASGIFSSRLSQAGATYYDLSSSAAYNPRLNYRVPGSPQSQKCDDRCFTRPGNTSTVYGSGGTVVGRDVPPKWGKQSGCHIRQFIAA